MKQTVSTTTKADKRGFQICYKKKKTSFDGIKLKYIFIYVEAGAICEPLFPILPLPIPLC